MSEADDGTGRVYDKSSSRAQPHDGAFGSPRVHISASDHHIAPRGGWLAGSAARTPPQHHFVTIAITRLAAWLLHKSLKIDAANLLGLMMNHRRLAWPLLVYSSRLAPHGTLTRPDTELVILRVAWNCRCKYEWGQHVAIAQQVGVTSDEVMHVKYGSQAGIWNARQAALLDAADDIHRTRLIADATWTRLERHYRTREMIELCMLVGHYEGLAGLLNSFGLPLEADN